MPPLFPAEIIKSSSESYFAEQRTAGRIIYLAVMLFLATVIGLLPFVTVQVSTQSEGVVRSGDEENPVVPVVAGEVLLSRMAENQPVGRGDTLLVLASDRIDQEISLLTFRQQEENRMMSDLKKLIRGETEGLLSAPSRQEYALYAVKLAGQQAQLQQAERDYLLAEILYRKGITPRHDFEKIAGQFRYEQACYQSVQAQQLSLWQEKLKQTTLNLADLEARVQQLKKERSLYCLTAPVAGTLTGYTGVKTGNFVAPNQPLARIAPEENLLVECYVSPADIGLIEAKMPVTFQFHAFNYHLWGMATGSVDEISNNLVSVNNRPFFRVKCRLDQHFLKLKNGCTGHLRKGMTLTGRFKVADRTLFQLLYDKADNWLNPKRKAG